MFDDRLYKRGALALHALRRHFGDGPFFDLLREWVDRYRHDIAKTSDFVALAAERCGDSAVPLLNDWLNERALPRLGP